METNGQDEHANQQNLSDQNRLHGFYNKFNPVGKDLPSQEQLREALENKRGMPAYSGFDWDPGLGEYKKISSKAIGAFIGDNRNVKVKKCKNPQEKGSFGFIDVFAQIECKSNNIDGKLILKFDKEKLGMVDSNSLRLFRFNPEEESFELIFRSAVSQYGDYVWGQINEPGLYTLIGINTDPLVFQTLQIMRSFNEYSAYLSPELNKLIRDRICLVILCPPDFREQLLNTDILERLDWIGSTQGYSIPRDSFGRLPGSGAFGNLCDFCLGLPRNPPELDIPTEPIPGFDPSCISRTWESIGPRDISGYILDIAIDPVTPGRIYAAGLIAGVWMLNDVNRYPVVSWSPLADRLLPISMSKLAIAPSDNSIIYGAGGDFAWGENRNKVYKSLNYGHNWNLAISGDIGQIWRITVHHSNPEIVFAASFQGVFISITGGRTWERILEGSFKDIVMDPQDSTIIYCCNQNKVYKLRGEPGSLSAELLFERPISSSSRTAEARLALGYRNSGGDLQTDSNRTVVFLSDEKIYLNNQGGRDTGEGWLLRGELDLVIGSHAMDFDEMCLAIDPYDPDVIIAGSYRLFRTINRGVSWESSEINGFRKHSTYLQVVFDRNEHQSVYIGTEVGVYRSRDSGASWTVDGNTIAEEISAGRNLNLDLVTSYHVPAIQNNRALGRQGYIVFRSDNIASGRWSRANSTARHITPDPKRNGRFYSVTESGLWMQVYPGEPSFFGDIEVVSRYHSALAIDKRPSSNLLLAGTYEGSLKTTRHGNRLPTLNSDGTWNNVPEWDSALEVRDSYIVAVIFSKRNPVKAYAITRKGHVYTTESVDTPGSWVLISDIEAVNVFHVAINSFGTEDHLYVADYGNMYKSIDSGRSWRVMGESISPAWDFNSIIPHPEDRRTLFVAAESGVYVSYDEGSTWSTFETGLPNVRFFNMLYDNGYLYLSSYHRGVWRRRLC